MMSKSSFWGSVRENLKRRAWTVLLCASAMLLFLPLRAAMLITSERSAMEEPGYLGAVVDEEAWLAERFLESITDSPAVLFLVAGAAILFAVQGFAWMDSRRKLDLYLSVPVSSRRRYLYIYLNGLAIFASCYLVSLLLSLTVGGLLGAVTFETAVRALLFFFCGLLLFLAVYNLALTAVMLTGNVLVTLTAILVFLFYEYGIRLLFDTMRQIFFATYSEEMSGVARSCFTSPLFVWLQKENGLRFLLNGNQRYAGQLAWLLGVLAVQAILYGGLAYVLYRKREADAAGRALAFRAGMTPVKLALMVPAALLMGVWFRSLSAGGAVYALLGMLAGLLLSHALIQIVYEFDVRSILHRKWHLLAAGGISALIYAVFALDLTGFDSYIPAADQVESVSVSLKNEYYGFEVYQSLFDRDMYYEEKEAYMLEHMNAAEPEAVEAVRQLAAWNLEYMQKDFSTDKTAASTEDGERRRYFPLMVRYTLHGGRKVYREILVECSQGREQMDLLFAAEGFKRARYQVLDDAFRLHADELSLIYSDGMEDFLFLGENERLLRAICQDLSGHSFTQRMEELPVGKLRIQYHLPGEPEGYSYDWVYPVYEDFKETLALMRGQEADLRPRADGGFLNPEEIVSIRITCYNLEREDVEYTPEGTSVSYSTDREVTETFTDPADIARIVPALYPSPLADMERSVPFDRLDFDNYEINVTYRPGVKYRNQYLSFVPVPGRLPGFVLEKTSYPQEN